MSELERWQEGQEKRATKEQTVLEWTLHFAKVYEEVMDMVHSPIGSGQLSIQLGIIARREAESVVNLIQQAVEGATGRKLP